MKKSTLFGLFVASNNINEAIGFIKNNFKVQSGLVFAYQSRNNILLSFTADRIPLDEVNLNSKYKIIILQRNKEFNVFFTINALNEIIKQKTGSKDETYKLDFSEYKESLLYRFADKTCVSKLKFLEEYNIKDYKMNKLNESDLTNEDE